MYASGETLHQGEIVKLLEDEGIKQGTKEFREAVRERFNFTDSHDHKGRPLYYEMGEQVLNAGLGNKNKTT